jgi:hypothetical protein
MTGLGKKKWNKSNGIMNFASIGGKISAIQVHKWIFVIIEHQKTD